MKSEPRPLAQRRVEAAWLALDPNTDAKTLDRMIQVARAGRRKRKEEQQQGQVSQGNGSHGQRARIIERDKATCYMCSRRLAIEDITLDHVVPRSRGGDDGDDNLKVACEPCNSRKGDRLISECSWLKHLH